MQNNIEKKAPLNFMGYRNAFKDLKELSKGFKILLLVGGIILIFFGFFSIDVYTDSTNVPENLKWMLGSHFAPFKQYVMCYVNGSPLGGKFNDSIAIASTILYSINGLAASTGLFAVAMIVSGKTSQFFWGLINAILFGVFALVVGNIGDFLGQAMLVVCAPLGWYLFNFIYKEGQANTIRSLDQWWLKLVVLLVALAFMVGLCFGWYYMVPVAYEGIFGLPYKITSTQHMFDGVANGVMMFGYFLQLGFIAEQFWLWEFLNVWKVLMYSPIGMGDNYVITIMIQYVVWASISGYGLYRMQILPIAEAIKKKRQESKTIKN
ncbi:nicotinamide mononucleotide transporter [Williamsoniiplasma lucivorax]|uniref:Nicotinamide mononucleotide transporter PnuC n=1 Tax=Williamsoniiplasma lucivorax TaxID=209274 RepID=A0A2S5RAE9_9MOLU|nr:nicotinamide mononucleotide transporter [Williamsoniiplasma lucivorax]PPE04314.1 nicotinamide mononucleotide transporter PnuC [Williamsoniiplasma lucivorax]